MFKEYKKIHRLGHEENDGILIGTCVIQEKIDGANTSIWMDDGQIKTGSRTRDLGDDDFNGFGTYAKNHQGIKQLLTDNPTLTLYGEWLVRHTIHYNETQYKQFYLFDIFNPSTNIDEGGFLPIETVEEMAKKYEINFAHVFAKITNPTLEQINEFVGKSVYGNTGEGVVIKNFDYTNKFGHKTYAKVVTEKFKEDNSLVFGGNNRHSETYWEMYCVNKYMTLGRIQKIMTKLQPLEAKRLDFEHTPRIINSAYHDLITEEIWEIQKKAESLHFGRFKKLATRKAAQIYHDLLGAVPISVADLHRQEKLNKNKDEEINNA